MNDVQSTSLEALESVKPTLGAKQSIVLRLLGAYPDLTNNEIGIRLGWSVNRVTPRVFELRERGLVEESRRRVCGVTGMRAIAWRRKRVSYQGMLNVERLESKQVSPSRQ